MGTKKRYFIYFAIVAARVSFVRWRCKEKSQKQRRIIDTVYFAIGFCGVFHFVFLFYLFVPQPFTAPIEINCN